MALSSQLLHLLFFVTSAHRGLTANDWTYENSDEWAHMYPTCGGQRQSPIDIVSSSVQFLDMGSVRLSDMYYDHTSNFNFTLLNNGHTVQANIDSHDNMNIQDGGLGDVYTLVQYHFHWGRTDVLGSEHALGGKYFAAEIHFVHYNSKYADLTVALKYPDGVAVLGFVLELSNANNTALDAIIGRLQNVTYASESVVIPAFSLRKLMPAQLGHFYRYNGSLTTPPCSEVVTWTVFDQPIAISKFQLGRLRSLYEGANSSSPLIASDYRPVQPLNGRIIYSNNPDYYIPPKQSTYAPSAADQVRLRLTQAIAIVLIANSCLFS